MILEYKTEILIYAEWFQKICQNKGPLEIG